VRVGDYELGQQLGEGGMATVYKARHVVLDTTHAVKVLNAKFRESADVRTRFLDEAKLQAKYLDHPNIVKVTNIVSTPEAAALVMELIEGTSLDKEIGRLKTDPADAKRIMLGILNGVGHAHSKGVIHRDIKPGNVLLARRGQKLFPKVTDFGIAKVNNPEANPAKKKTHVDAKMGTLAYMSPEQLRRARDVTPRSDVFSLGVMFYEMVTGVLPFEGENDYDVMESIVHARYTPPATRNPKLDPVIASVIETAIKADPAQRFASCEDMAAVLSGDKQLAAVLAAAPKPAVPTAKLTSPAEAPKGKSEPAKQGAVASTPLTVPPATQNSGGSSRLIGFGLLALALAIGALALVFALKKDPPPANTQNQNQGGGSTPAAPDDAGQSSNTSDPWKPSAPAPTLRPLPRNKVAPQATPPQPLQPLPPLPPSDKQGVQGGYGYCIVGPPNRAECAANPRHFSKWHFHGYVGKRGECFACFDEESSTCTELEGPLGYRYLGDDCAGVPESTDHAF